jgi:hypothetical protein
LLRRALDDLNEGIRCLLGSGKGRPDLVDELLGEGRRDEPPRREPRPERRRVAHRRPSRGPRLALVE